MINYQKSDDLKEKCSQILYKASRNTWENRSGRIGEVRTLYNKFYGSRYAKLVNSIAIGLTGESIGTKMEIAQRLSSYTGDFSYHSRIAHDLIAMSCDDEVREGREPILVTSILHVNKFNTNLIQNLAKGMVSAARKARVAVINGESAEYGNIIGGYGRYRYVWDAFAVSLSNEDKIITGENVRPGDKVVSFKEKGFRSNGLSLFRNIMRKHYGVRWHENEYEGRNVAELALTPSEIYCAVIVDTVGGYNKEPRASIKAVIHNTGGGAPEKLRRVLERTGYGAELSDLFKPSKIMLHTQEVGKLRDIDAYKEWNMGNGMFVITEEPEKIITIAKEHSIEARLSGEVIEKPVIKIRSKGFYSKRESELVFPITIS